MYCLKLDKDYIQEVRFQVFHYFFLFIPLIQDRALNLLKGAKNGTNTTAPYPCTLTMNCRSALY